MKMIHPSMQGLCLSDAPSGTCNRAPAAPSCLLSGLDQSHSMRPLTKCHAANEACELREHDHRPQTPALLPQTLLLQSASHQLLCKHPQRVPKSAVVSASPCAHATLEDGRHISSGDAWSQSPTATRSLPLQSPSAPAPAMAYNYPQAGSSTSRSTQFPFVNDATAGMPFETDVLNYLYEGLDQMSYDFPEDVLSQLDFSVGEQQQRCGLNVCPPNQQSPIFRSMSRSSFGSSSYMESSSPDDYPTPTSDSSVTTPALSDAAFGFLPDLRYSPFGQEAPAFASEAKTKGELDCSYVHAFPGSAPLSPNAFCTYSFDACQPQALALPSNEGNGLAGARRHSEPASLAALQFPLFFQEQLAQIAPTLAATRSITDNLTGLPPAPGPSSIAPHQTQLPRPLEIMQPKPVRAFKPPILRGDRHYDPKDFVRRHSEPVLPLPVLDVFSHEAASECPEEDETMDGEDELYDEGDYPDDMGDDALMDDFAFEGVDEQGFPSDVQGESLFDPEWTWYQPASSSSAPATAAPQQAWPGAALFGVPFDWTTAFAAPSTSGFVSDTRPHGFTQM
ncbi:uncharacterized protein TRAVEDRAFT_67950 [Trametes versicolor FP-101664 SS1]|uniref:uncharacterized protein n=1 Tax=Trametes versicolor (strain FP-101664) TaxID=717944 RepID=UPI0004622906|nr:uncharacterized protein TRAVEDRAFT_67950 [Trametes versicolor FP-101664 SS1]EIW64044.1 hypothetical protein TRAVEDRAFT_67950 [Trametes versicolor FP-101664 SS1]